MPENVLITGCNGFVGTYLITALANSTLYGIDLQPEGSKRNIAYSRMDLTDSRGLKKIIEDNGISQVYHLAAVSNPRTASSNPLSAVSVNTMGTVNLFEASRGCPDIKLLIIGSAVQYGKPRIDTGKIDESHSLNGDSIYAATKTSSEVIGKAYAEEFNMHIAFTRSFNHTGPGRSENFVLSSFAKQCAEIKKGMRKPLISVGNIDIYRDFLDARDTVTAYQHIMEQGESGGVYNVCSGKQYKLRELLEEIVSFTGVDNVVIDVDQNRIRPDEPERLYGDNSKLKKLGWVQRFPMQQTLHDLFEYWMKYEPDN